MDAWPPYPDLTVVPNFTTMHALLVKMTDAAGLLRENETNL